MVYKNASFNFPSHWKTSKKRGKVTTFFPTRNAKLLEKVDLPTKYESKYESDILNDGKP